MPLTQRTVKHTRPARTASLPLWIGEGGARLLVLIGDEAVVEDAQALVAPQAQDGRRRRAARRRGQQQALQHAAQVARVEQVVEARGRGRQRGQHVGVQLQQRADEVRGHGCAHAIPCLHPARQASCQAPQPRWGIPCRCARGIHSERRKDSKGVEARAGGQQAVACPGRARGRGRTRNGRPQRRRVVQQDGRADGAQAGVARHLDGEGGHEGEQARVERVARAAREPHRAQRLHVPDLPPLELLAAAVHALRASRARREGRARAAPHPRKCPTYVMLILNQRGCVVVTCRSKQMHYEGGQVRRKSQRRVRRTTGRPARSALRRPAHQPALVMRMHAAACHAARLAAEQLAQQRERLLRAVRVLRRQAHVVEPE